MVVIRTQKEIQQRAPLWLGVLLALNVVLMSFDARDDVSKQRVVRVWAQGLASVVQRPLSAAGNTGTGFFAYFSNLRHAAEENERLRDRVAAMETELRETRFAVGERDRLQGLLDLKREAHYGVVAASVIARDPSVWFDSVVINRGRTAGVELGMPVVTADGVVGRVVATSPLTAQVMLITDERSGAGAIVGQLGASQAFGSVRGLGDGNLVRMNYVPGLEKVEAGDKVWTTGQDEIYPPGLSVGTVTEVKLGTANSPHVISVKPSARLDALQDVAVLQYKPGARPAPDQALPNVNKKK